MNRHLNLLLSTCLLLALLALCTVAGAEAADAYAYEIVFAGGINAENAEDEDGVRTIHEGGLSCGPYINLMQGAYRVRVTGENLTGMGYDVVSMSEDSAYVLYPQGHTDTELVYGFILEAPAANIEARFFNQGTQDVVLAACVIEAIEVEDLMSATVPFGDNLNVQNGEDEGGRRILHEGGLSYGPYITLIPGIYEVTIEGENLAWALPKFTSQYGAESFTLYNLQTTDTRIRYRVQVTEMIQQVEITVYNPTPEPILIDSIAVGMQ